jgi:hypothetical protein
MVEARHQMAVLAVIWHARATQLKPAEVRIDWMYINIHLRAQPLQEQGNGVLLIITTTQAQMPSMRISLLDTAKCRGVMTGDILLGI